MSRPVPDDVELAVPEDLQTTAEALRRLVQTLEERRRMEGNESVRLPISRALPLRRLRLGGQPLVRAAAAAQPELKQRLMELDSPLMRLELVSDLLARTGITK